MGQASGRPLRDGQARRLPHSGRKKKDRTQTSPIFQNYRPPVADANRGAIRVRRLSLASDRVDLLCGRLHRGLHRSLLLHRGLRRGHLALARSSGITTAATTTIAAAAVASAMATTSVMATAATVAARRMAAAVATSAAVAASMMASMATAAAARAAAAAKDEGRSLVFTAHEGETNQGEKHRQAKHNNTIHPQSSSYLQVP